MIFLALTTLIFVYKLLQTSCFYTIFCSSKETVEGASSNNSNTVVLNNVKFSTDLWATALDTLGSAAVFKAGMTSALKAYQNAPIPPFFKTLIVTSAGAGAFIAFKTVTMTINAARPGSSNTTFEVQKVETSSDISSFNKEKGIEVKVTQKASNSEEFDIDNFGPFSPSCPLESEKANHISLLLDILDNTLLLNMIVFILVLLVIMGLTFKLLSEMDSKLEWIKKIYFGDKIHFMVIKLTTMWKKTNISIIYFALFCILIFVGLNSYFLYSLSIMFHKVFNSLL